MKTAHLNSSKAFKPVKRADPPDYASHHGLEWLRKYLGLRVQWVDTLIDLSIGNSPGDSVYDRRVLLLNQRAGVETYLHDLCHALVARAYRPESWDRTPNFGCEGEKEEVEVCYLQMALLERWACWGTYDPISILQDYGFAMEVDAYCSDEGYPNEMTDLWRRVVRRGWDTARKLHIPLATFPKRQTLPKSVCIR